MRVAGLAPLEVPTIENVNVTEFVPGHMAYRAAMPKLLREVGWIVESDEFTEIEDPDPENHEKRQRELINEIEEARKELEKKAAEKEKKGGKLSWWSKKKVDKKKWEVYDEKSLAEHHKTMDKDADPAKLAENPVMFDIDAIRREVAALAAESKEYNAEAEFEIKEIKSTLPPMKIDISTLPPQTSPRSNLRETKSYNDSLGISTLDSKANSTSNLPSTNGTHTPNGPSTQAKQSFDEYDEFNDPGSPRIQMTFDSSFRDPMTPAPSTSTSKSPLPLHDHTPERTSSPWESPPAKAPWKPDSQQSTAWEDANPPAPVERPPLSKAKTEPSGANITPGYNAWADEFDDDFGKEKEVKMSFM